MKALILSLLLTPVLMAVFYRAIFGKPTKIRIPIEQRKTQ